MELNKHNCKSGRYRYFQLHIRFALFTSKNFLWGDNATLVSLLKSNNLISQEKLEKLLFNLEVQSLNQVNKLVNFYGQLERDFENDAPYWNIICETRYVTTPRIVGSFLSKQLNPSLDFIDPIVKVKAISKLEELDEDKRFSLPDSNWYPGYFSHAIMYVSQMLKNQEILKAIEERPDKFSNISLKVSEKEKILN